MLTDLENIGFFQNFENYDTIPLDVFLTFFANRTKILPKIEKSPYLLDFLDKYRNLTDYNLHLIDKYCILIQNISDLLKYHELLKKKEILEKEMKIVQLKTRSGDLAAKTDLLKKLTISQAQSKKQVTYLKEDYLKIKNQKDEIFKELESYKTEIEELSKQKKDFFNQINKITRGMDGPVSDDGNNKFQGITRSQQIKSLQLNAKDVQFKINQVKTKLEKSKIKFDQIYPKFEKIEQDYLLEVNNIENDDKKIKNLKTELEDGLKGKDIEEFQKIDIIMLDIIKPKKEIEADIITINRDLSKFEKSTQMLNKDVPQYILEIRKEIDEINDILTNKGAKFIIPQERKLIIEIMESFKNLDVLIKKIENMVNKFLFEINLKCIFNLTLINNKSLSINILFTRSSKETIEFQDLTTPEKIFFILSFYFSLQMQFDNKDLIFSNIYIHAKYNKKGSIFRTIKKLMPIFENESIFKKYRLIFILSNLEFNDAIDNLTVINI